MDRNDYYGGDSTSLNLNQVSNSYNLCLRQRVLDLCIDFLVITKLSIHISGTFRLTCFPIYLLE
jgi:RAB protein geranylgeranyltransferase component A